MKPHIPIRECVCCGKKAPKRDLFRIVKKDGKISFDSEGKAQGRGAYVCASAECREQMIVRKKLNRAFRQNVAEEDYLRISEEIK